MTTSGNLKPRIAVFMPNAGGGGAERVTIELCRQLQEWFEIQLVLQCAVGELLPDTNDLRTIDLDSPRIARTVVPLARYLQNAGPACLLTVMTHCNIIGVVARELARLSIPLVLMQHNTLSEESKNSGRRRDLVGPALARLTYPRADMVCAVSAGVASDLVRHRVVPSDRVTVTHNPIDYGRIYALSQEPGSLDAEWLRSSAAGPLILSIGRLTRQKDFSTLLRSLPHLSDQNARLVIAGQGPQEAELRQLCRQLGIDDRVIFAGFVPNPYPLFRIANAYVSSSIFEGLPTVLLEALRFDLPIVATDCPHGPREILDDGRWGLLVPPREPVQLAKAIDNALQKGPRGVDAPWHRYSAPHVAARFAEMLEHLLEPDGRSAASH